MARLMACLLTSLLHCLFFVNVALAANMPLGGCRVKKVCKKLAGLETAGVDADNFRNFSHIGNYIGVFNSQDGEYTPHERGSGSVNYEIYQEVGNYFDVVKGVSGSTLMDCCKACARSSYCYQYHFFNSKLLKDNAAVKGFMNKVQCYLLEKVGGSGTSGSYSTPYSGDAKEQSAKASKYPVSWLGGLCNGIPLIENDPHLTGAHGTRFDFTGRLDKSFCLLSDQRLHINMLLAGYQGIPPAVAASTALPDATSSTQLHTWIKELGIVWLAADGKRHSVRMVARRGKQQERGAEGFMSQLQLDGTDVAPPFAVGASVEGDGGLVLTKVAEEKEGPFDVDVYALLLAGLAQLDVRMRVAHPLLQTPDEAEAHFNLQLTDVQTTAAVHGVLGQTFRNTPQQMERAVKFSHLSTLLQRPVAVDKQEGSGFLDGTVDDYITSSVTSSDCKFSSFSTAVQS